MARAFYRGFSTADWGKRKTFQLTNIDLVKRDLLNHIYTVKGERVMMPGFGTHIPVMAFEPNDERLRAQLESELREVFDYDPRVELLDLQVLIAPDNNALLAFADLRYIEFDVRDTLRIEVPKR